MSALSRSLVVALLGVFAFGCSSNLKGGNLYTSNVFFLPPSAATTVYLETHNTSDNQQVALNDLSGRLAAKGYQVVADPAQAQYVVQANTIYCNTEKQLITMETMVAGGYGSSIGGTISSIGDVIGQVGGMAGMANPMIGMGAGIFSGVTGTVGGAVDSIGGLFGGNSPEEEMTYACVTDVQITERVVIGQNAAVTTPHVYQTRLVAGVHQKKLDLQEATPLVQQKLSIGVAGNF